MGEIKYIKGVSPKGTCKWAHVVTPQTKFNPDGVYSIELMLPEGEECDAFKATMEKMLDAFMEQTKKGLKPAQVKMLSRRPAYSEEYDEEDAPTGYVKFKFKCNALYLDKKTGLKQVNTVGVYDSHGTQMKQVPNIGNGSTVRVSYIMTPYYVPGTGFVGVTLKLKAVQIIDLVEYGSGGDAKGYGFGVEEGYVAPAVSETPDEPESGDF